jgi:leukotriene-A4 hydrolase
MAAEFRSGSGNHVTGSMFHFVMTQPIPSYLIALAVGELEFRPLGKRTGVWAEPSVVQAAAHEFADVEKMVESAEKQFGPYRWGRYDILVLPPSFPFGGMENPRLTFATPTVLAGDRSLVSLVAHELAHSWSGNLVTNATWSDFWLNEGFTTYLERRIVEDIYGRDRADMEAVLGMAELRDELGRLAPKDQILHVDLNGRDPDDGMTQIPYEKGSLFLRTLEQACGRAHLDAFLRAYFEEYAFKSITTRDFVEFARDRLIRMEPRAAASIDLDAWLERPGLPAAFAEPKSVRLAAIDQMAQSWQKGTIVTNQLGANEWSTQEWLRFSQALPEKLPVEKLTELDRAFGLTGRGNSEIAHQWLLMSIHNGYEPADSRLASYLTSIGRRKFVLPLYRALLATPQGKARAEAIYATARPTYHPITANSIDRLMSQTK